MATQNASALLTGSVTFGGIPQSLFGLLQNLMDQHQWDPTIRTAALASLVAYHAATANDDQFHGVVAINQIKLDALMLLAHMYNQYGSGIYGVYSMPSDRPAPVILSEVLSRVATTRTTKNRPALPGPKS